MNYHKSVLLQEGVDALNVGTGNKYIDATLGGGGHTSEIINRGGRVLGIDADSDAIDFVSKSQREEIESGKLTLARGNFRDIDQIAHENGFGAVSGMIFDLGVSSYQLDNPDRGFSYLTQGPLDMRMDQRLGVRAADLVNALAKNELYEIFTRAGEERRARQIAEAIISARKDKKIETTGDLVEIAAKAYGFKNLGDFAKAESGKRIFQALRIVVNDELGALEEALPKCLKLLEGGGTLVVITFHSLEDRIVKQSFLRFEKEGKGKIVTKKPILPTIEEVKGNKRAKSAKLRIFEKNE